MRKAIGLVLALSTTTPVLADFSNQYGWKHRPLLIFAPSGASPELVEQQQILSGQRQALRDRDMALIEVAGAKVRTRFGPEPGLQATELRRRFRIEPGAFAVILVGKDGGVKLRSAEPVSAESVFGLIDGMPMRRQEMRERGKS